MFLAARSCAPVVTLVLQFSGVPVVLVMVGGVDGRRPEFRNGMVRQLSVYRVPAAVRAALSVYISGRRSDSAVSPGCSPNESVTSLSFNGCGGVVSLRRVWRRAA